ncbi:MAG: Type IV pilus assembly protein PilM [Candidatus Woesebacteria bacterium GW2011_GWA1_39_8]|uniref:Type IV pilus assembly protein PilM n=1 Tax=Candidatus Woesebacteria bacterium GW2011_GWA1_39_8 TaxID=1618552 RepID=A0A0G0PR75_9BACT|nr:MAG: Type IV pilus assembly protein PilM [Candidatus Woesebacteria bacterium GW2011_GWA1_39_8]
MDLPEGIIEGARIIDSAALSRILENVWAKLHIKERAIGIILPEASTFTKFFKLPKLAISELAEAVNWQAQEFLPSSQAETITDWKIIDKTPEGYEILIVAVSKEVLSQYVSACEEAGLFPLVVETPSTCLVRLSKKDSSGSLIIYKNFGEALLVVAQGERIVGTSVIKGADPKQIIKTSSQMLTHFKEVQIKTLSLGGTQITEELVARLTDQLKLQFLLIQPEVSGIEKAKLQEYLIPLSMQLSEPAEPSDPNSLNLLPFSLVEKYKKERLRLQVWGLTLTITLFTWISFLITLGAYLFMVQNINSLKLVSKVNAETTKKREEAVSNIKTINKISEKILAIKKISVLPQKILNTIDMSKPQGIAISGYNLDLDRGEVSLTGISVDRASLINFKQKLETNTDYTSVTIPISSFEKEINLEFTLSFLYKPLVPPEPTKKKGK